MKISFRYKTGGGAGWLALPMTPEVYFDPPPEQRPFEWDDVPALLSSDRYLGLPPEEDVATEIMIRDPDDRLALVQREVWWARRKHCVIHRHHEGLELLIVHVSTGEVPTVWHTIRLNRYPGNRGLLEHLQALDVAGRQSPGPSTSLHVTAAPEVSWHDGESRCRLLEDEGSFRCEVRFVADRTSGERHSVQASFRSGGGVHVEHRVDRASGLENVGGLFTLSL